MQENPESVDLRTALESAFAEADKPETPEPTTAAPEQEPDKATRVRDEAGRFAKTEPESVSQPVTSETQTHEPVEPVAPERKAPSSWKPDAQAAFNQLPPHVQEEVLRRETDYHKGIETYKTHAHAAQAFERVIQPHMATFQQLGIDAPTAVQKLLQADHTLRYADAATKAQYLTQLAREYGIDIAQAANQPQPDPQVLAMQQQLAQTQREMQAWKQEQQRAQESVVMTEIEKFAADPANVHFTAVRDDMAVLLQSGIAQSLKDAYDKAVWQRGDIRQSLIEQQRAEAQKQAIEQAQHAKAKAASVSVKGSSPSAGGIQPVKGSLRDQLVAAFAET